MTSGLEARMPRRVRAPEPSKLFTRKSPLIDIGQFIVLIGAIAWVTYAGAAAMEYNWQWYRVDRYIYQIIDGEFIFGPLLRGLGVTFQLTGYSIVLTFVIGLVTALFRMSGSFSGRLLATVYLEAIRNTPLLVQLFIFYFVISPIIGIDRFWTGVICLAFFEGSFATEIIRAGLESVPRGQYEAADALGFNRLDRFRDIVLPQAVPLILPPIMTSNFFASRAGIIPDHAVGTNWILTPMSAATCVATSISKPMRSPFLSRMAHGTNVDMPTRSVPRFLISSITLAAASSC